MKLLAFIVGLLLGMGTAGLVVEIWGNQPTLYVNHGLVWEVIEETDEYFLLELDGAQRTIWKD